MIGLELDVGDIWICRTCGLAMPMTDAMAGLCQRDPRDDECPLPFPFDKTIIPKSGDITE